ncbi:MAG: hypothetical protein ACFFD8_00125 [Candidatus Thorarchaeota archaeon]
MKSIFIVLLISALIGASPLLPPSSQSGAFRGSPFPITVQLRSQSGSPIENASILFFHETHNQYLGDAITNATGHATFIWQIPITHNIGPVQLNATYRGDPEKFLLPSLILIPLTVYAQIVNNISIKDADGNLIPSIVNKNQQLFFHILVLNDQLLPLEGITVQLLQEPNKLIKEGLSSQNGSIILDCLVNQTINNEITFTIRSLTEGYYNGTSQNFLFSIEPSARFIGLPTFWNPSNNLILNGRLCQVSGFGISNAPIELLHENNSSIAITNTDEEGYFHFNVTKVFRIIEKNQFVILRFNGTPENSPIEIRIGIIPGSSINPFEETIEIAPPDTFTPLLQQITIIVVGGIAISTAFLSIRLKRTTRRIVSC